MKDVFPHYVTPLSKGEKNKATQVRCWGMKSYLRIGQKELKIKLNWPFFFHKYGEKLEHLIDVQPSD